MKEYLYVCNCSKQGLLTSKVSMLGNIPKTHNEGVDVNGNIKISLCI